MSRQYQTPLPGSPGSPIHVMAFNATSNSVLICWLDSSSGQPFLEYKFEVEESGEDRQKTFRKDSDEVTSYPNITGCNKGILVRLCRCMCPQYWSDFPSVCVLYVCACVHAGGSTEQRVMLQVQSDRHQQSRNRPT